MRYVTPLREGGSLPAILETDTGELYVAKFRGAGQGARALVAELIVGGLALAAGLRMPAIALIMLDESFGRSERDPEIQDLLKGSVGMNVGLAYLDGAFNYDPLAVTTVDPAFAADLVWLDAFTTNIDRTARNPNLMVWNGDVWLIDHGAALFFHHNWATVDDERARSPFGAIKDHVLLSQTGDLLQADERMRGHLGGDTIESVLAAVPDELFMDAPAGLVPSFATPDAAREAYAQYFHARLDGRAFVEEAVRAREALAAEGGQRTLQRYRR